MDGSRWRCLASHFLRISQGLFLLRVWGVDGPPHIFFGHWWSSKQLVGLCIYLIKGLPFPTPGKMRAAGWIPRVLETSQNDSWFDVWIYEKNLYRNLLKMITGVNLFCVLLNMNGREHTNRYTVEFQFLNPWLLFWITTDGHTAIMCSIPKPRKTPSPPTHHFAGPGGIQISTAAWKSSGWNSENGWFVNGISFFQRGHFFTFPSWVNHPFFNWKFLELGGKIRWHTLLPCLFLFWGPCFTVVPFLGRFARQIQGWRCICRAECHAYQLCAVA